MSTSDTHRILTALYERQRALGVAFRVFQVLDLNNAIVERSGGVDQATPANAYGAEVGKRAWVLRSRSWSAAPPTRCSPDGRLDLPERSRVIGARRTRCSLPARKASR